MNITPEFISLGNYFWEIFEFAGNGKQEQERERENTAEFLFMI